MGSTKALIRKSKGQPVVNKDGLANVYIQYLHNRKSVLFYTGVRVNPDHWNGKEVRTPVKGITDKKERELIKRKDNSDNSTIKKKQIDIDLTVQSLEKQDADPSVNRIRELMDGKKQEIKKENDSRFIDLFRKYVDDNQLNLANGTHRHYKVTTTHLQKFLKKIRKPNILLSDIDFEFVEDFKRFCISGLGLSNGSANNHIKRLKRFLSYQNEKGNYESLSFKKVGLYKYKIEDQKKIYLTKDEIIVLYNFKFEPSYKIQVPATSGKTETVTVNKKTLEKARDLFILGCFTGLRFSDVAQLTPENINNGFIELVTVKTQKELSIPVILYAKDVLEKYPDGLPLITQQKLNIYIKNICRIVGIDDKIKLPSWRGKDRKDEIFHKYDLITSHTMKKTFVMLCVNEGIAVEVVASITGNSIKTLSHYYDIENETKVKHLQKLVESFKPVMKVSS